MNIVYAIDGIFWVQWIDALPNIKKLQNVYLLKFFNMKINKKVFIN